MCLFLMRCQRVSDPSEQCKSYTKIMEGIREFTSITYFLTKIGDPINSNNDRVHP